MRQSDIDTKFARAAWRRALERTAPIERNPHVTLPALIDPLAREFGAAPALLSAEAALSFSGLAARCNQYARFGMARGLKAGDVVCLMLPNCAEYPAIWLGLTRIGATVALLNTQLVEEPLLHAIAVAGPHLLIVGAALLPAVEAVSARLPPKLPRWVLGGKPGDGAALEPQLRHYPGDALRCAEFTAPSLDATALYIYTSGTTGLPKAAVVSHYRLMRWSHWFAGLLDTSPDDRMYNCLPLYHSVGGVVAIGATLLGGGATVIRERFSSSTFWHDVRAERCTLFQYIGELCRYLTNAPPQERETEHRLRLACGNGLRPDVWEAFKTRFAIPRIIEYYASTEGNFSLYNCEGESGAIGRIPPYLSQRLPVALLRVDLERNEPLRDHAGFCERCAVDEAGEAVAAIGTAEDARLGRFEGYAEHSADAAKVLHDVFARGDHWYRTGDLMRRDARGFYYFVDRLGDTYRWKGENVSTSEVLAALAKTHGVIEGVVYGVAVPGADGRAGMAALVVDDRFDLADFRAQVGHLPGYARPVFLRLLPALETTGTFKASTQELRRGGFDPSRTNDPLYYADLRNGGYSPLDAAAHAAISAGTIRF